MSNEAKKRIAQLNEVILQTLIIPNSKLPAYARDSRGRKIGPESFEPQTLQDQEKFDAMRERFTSLAFADRRAEKRLAEQAVENLKAEIKAKKAENVEKYRQAVENDQLIQFESIDERFQYEAEMAFAEKFGLMIDETDEFICEDCHQHLAQCCC